MALETISLKTLNFYAPRFEVEIEGKRISADVSKIIKDVKVEEAKDQASSFTITVSVEYDRLRGGFKWLDDPLFKEGNKILIRMGYGSDMTTMIKGSINELESNFFSGDAPTLTLKGFDFSCGLRKQTGEASFVDMKYSEIVEEIARRTGFLNTVIDPTETYERVLRKKSDESYFNFISEKLAAKCGYEFGIDRDNKLYFIKPRADGAEVITLEWGKDLISFNPRMSLSELVKEVEVRGHNPDDPSSPIVGKAQAGSELVQEKGRTTGSQLAGKLCPEAKRVVTVKGPVSQKQADKMALSIMNRASDTLFTGSGECIGIPQIRPLVAIRLEKLGERFSGKYYLQTATHTISDSGYRTGFTVKRNAL